MSEGRVLRAFFSLLRSGLWGSEIDDIDCFPLNEEQWTKVYKIASSQTVEAFLYDGVQKLPFDFLPPKQILLKWVVVVSKIEGSNERMNSCINEQVSFFNKIGVQPILLKGQGVANYYPTPTHRACGDIDWYFGSLEESLKVKSELELRKVKIFSSTADSYNYLWRSCEVESLTKLFDVFNPFVRMKLERLRKEQALKGNERVLKDAGYYTLVPNLNILQVNLHILKHLLAFGVGLRQFCDSAILYDRLNEEYDKNWLYKTYKDIGIINWTYVLHDFLVHYIGLSEDKLPFALNQKYSSEGMMKDVIATGNFGFFDENFTDLGTDNQVVRKHKAKKLWHSFNQYYKLAPYEAISFPIVHFFERFKSIVSG